MKLGHYQLPSTMDKGSDSWDFLGNLSLPSTRPVCDLTPLRRPRATLQAETLDLIGSSPPLERFSSVFDRRISLAERFYGSADYLTSKTVNSISTTDLGTSVAASIISQSDTPITLTTNRINMTAWLDQHGLSVHQPCYATKQAP